MRAALLELIVIVLLIASLYGVFDPAWAESVIRQMAHVVAQAVSYF